MSSNTDAKSWDSLHDPFLANAPRVEYAGKQVSSLDGIPLVEYLGGGGMGAVYRGFHPRLDKEVAVKVMRFELAQQDTSSIQRFLREARLAAKVESPHLVQVYDVREENGIHFIVMEYVPGRSAGKHLKALHDSGTWLSELGALEVAIAATEGLLVAHEHDIVHRDVKPDNIMIPCRAQGSAELNLEGAKLTDLGLARHESSQQSLWGSQNAMGTPGFMPPEQALDARKADKRSDVFGIGATLYALLCGHAPFAGETIMKVLLATLHDAQKPIVDVRPGVSRAVNELVEKCLAKEQARRYPDARGLLHALQDCRRLLTSSGTARTIVYMPAAATPPPAAALDTSEEQTQLRPRVTPPPAQDRAELAQARASTQAPAPRRGMLFAGATVAAAVVLAVCAVLVPRLYPSPHPIIDPVVLERITKEHRRYIEEARNCIKEGNAGEAKLNLGLAQAWNLPGDEARKLEEEISAGIKDLEAGMELDEKYKYACRLAQKGEWERAITLLQKAKLLLPAEDPRVKKIEDKLKEIGKSIVGAKKRKEARDALDKARDTGKDEPELALEKVAEVLKSYPDSGDELNQEARKVERALKDANAERLDRADYDRLIKEVEAAFNAGNFELANTKAHDAQVLMPKRDEADIWIAKIAPKLDEATRKRAKEAADKEHQQKLAAWLKTAEEQHQQGHLNEALASLRKALDISPQHAGALDLQERLQQALDKQKQEEELRKNTKRFAELLNLATELTLSDDTADLDEAAQKVADARSIFPGDKDREADAAPVEARIGSRREALKAKAGYDTLVKRAKEARAEGRLKDAKDLVEQALLSPLKDSSAETLMKAIDDEIAKEDERHRQIAGRDAQYNELLNSGGVFVTAADRLGPEAFDEKISQLNSALREFRAAKALKPDGQAAKRESEVEQKLNQTKLDRASSLRRQFDAKIALADEAARKGNFEAADDCLAAAKGILPDDDAAVATLAAKSREYQGLRVDSAISTAMGQVLEALKKNPADIGAAMRPAQDACQAYPSRREMAAVLDTLRKLENVDAAVKQACANASATITELRRGTGNTGTVAELRIDDDTATKVRISKLEKARERLQGLVSPAVKKLADSSFKDAAVVLQDLETDLHKAADEIAR